ncbi:peptidoglycan bridge formation glycyltransferase FemA/FemB family protein [Candidatus Dojkabacteria bacterium]|nr:peptidoglycan bridge formation glycyltransferase FemA/FemB family protein [Candidatus Dojkabacteria bacterium]
MIIKAVDKKQYDELFQKHKFSILQSWQWGEIKSADWKVERLIVGNFPVTIFYKKFPIFGFKFGYIARGFSDDILENWMLIELTEYAKEDLKLSHLIIDPNMTKGQESFSQAGFKITGKTIQPNQTNIIDLAKNEEELWRGLSSSMKRTINKARKNCCSVQIERDPVKALEVFLEMNSKINARNSYSKFSDNYYRRIWEKLQPEDMAEVLVLKHKEENIGAYFVAYAGESAYEWYGGVNDSGKELKAGPLLKWESIMEAKKRELKYYDQWGVARKTGEGTEDFKKNDPLYYVSVFKMRFGGTYKQFLLQQTIVFRGFQYRIYQLGETAVKLKLKLQNLIKG